MSTAGGSEPEERPDPFSRRREVAATSARSLLMTVLGEIVLPAGRPVWTQTVVDVLGLVGVEEKSARQALARTAADGMLTSERVGRRVRWDLSPWGHGLLTEGAARIYAHGRARPAWDGRWLVVVASVPEQQRARRHRLRTRLAWAGLGSPAAGMWVSTDTGRLDEVREVLAEIDPADAHVITGEYEGGLSSTELAARAWDLGDLAARYADFVARFADLAPADRRRDASPRRCVSSTPGAGSRSSTPGSPTISCPTPGWATAPPRCSTAGTPNGPRARCAQPGPSAWSARPLLNPDRLRVDERLGPEARELAAVAGVLRPAERHLGRRLGDLVDVDHARLDLGGEPLLSSSSSVQALPPSPKSESLAIRIASSASRARKTSATGPNSSSR